MSVPIRPTVEYKGQPYVDEPVMVRPKMLGEMEYSVGRCFNSAQQMVRRVPPAVQVAWQQIKLNWVQK